jgi:hypothetical protein
MSVRNLGGAVASELYQSHLKALGFRKERSTFTRHRNGYVELFHISGSQWNAGDEPWLFYLEVGVQFDEIPPRAGARGIWRRVHALGRIGKLVPGAPESFEVNSSSVAPVSQDLAALVAVASERLPNLLERVRVRARKGLASPLPVPDTWTMVRQPNSRLQRTVRPRRGACGR